MKRTDQMLHDFDRLAAAELADIASYRRVETERRSAAPPEVRAPAGRRVSSAWTWLFGVGALALVVLAARR